MNESLLPGMPERDTKRLRMSQFTKPTIGQVADYCREIGLPEDEAEGFWHHHEARGWMLGKVHMVCWRSALQTWKRNYGRFNVPIAFKPLGGQREPTISELKAVIAAKTDECGAIQRKHAYESAMGLEWDCEGARKEWLALRKEIKQLNYRIAHYKL